MDKEWLALLGERLELLSHEPIDAGEFHSTLTGLLTEKIRLLEFVKLGPDERESAPAGVWRDSLPPGVTAPAPT